MRGIMKGLVTVMRQALGMVTWTDLDGAEGETTTRLEGRSRVAGECHSQDEAGLG